MRLPDSPMTDDEFDEALDLARNGEIMTDTGAGDAVLDALLAVVTAAPNPPDALISAARAAYQAAK